MSIRRDRHSDFIQIKLKNYLKNCIKLMPLGFGRHSGFIQIFLMPFRK